MNIANIQWILCILLIITLMKDEPNSKYGNLYAQFSSDIAVLIICGLTGPFLLILMPLFCWKWLKNRTAFNFGIVLVTAVVTVVQLQFISSLFIQSQDNDASLDLNTYSVVIGNRIMGNLFLGNVIAYKVNHYLLSGLYFCLIFTILKFSSLKNNFILICVGTTILITIPVFFKFRSNLYILIPPENGPRYLYVQYVMITWSLIALLWQTQKWKNYLILVTLALIVMSSVTSGFRSSLIDYNWNLHSKSIGRESVEIPINPSGWKIQIDETRRVDPNA